MSSTSSLLRIVAAAALAVGCGGAAQSAASKAVAETPASETAREETKKGPEKAKDADDAPPGGAAPSAPSAVDAQRDPSKIVYTARVTMAVYQVEQGLAAVETIGREEGGFLAVKHDREITIRVPRQKFEAALARVDGLGDVLHRDVEAADVTDEFVDLEIRIKNARAMQTRLKALLEKAAVKDALEIEKELHRVTEELERLEGRLAVLRDRIAYSTITVAFEPRGATLQASRVRLPFPWLGQLGLPNLLTLSEEKTP